VAHLLSSSFTTDTPTEWTSLVTSQLRTKFQAPWRFRKEYFYQLIPGACFKRSQWWT